MGNEVDILALLDELERLEKRATEGPWKYTLQEAEKDYDAIGNIRGSDGYLVCDNKPYNSAPVDITDQVFIVQIRNSLSTLIQFCREAAQVTEFYAEAEYIPEGLNDKTDLGEKAREFRRKWGLE